jgi:hypothetical protein
MYYKIPTSKVSLLIDECKFEDKIMVLITENVSFIIIRLSAPFSKSMILFWNAKKTTLSSF